MGQDVKKFPFVVLLVALSFSSAQAYVLQENPWQPLSTVLRSFDPSAAGTVINEAVVDRDTDAGSSLDALFAGGWGNIMRQPLGTRSIKAGIGENWNAVIDAPGLGEIELFALAPLEIGRWRGLAQAADPTSFDRWDNGAPAPTTSNVAGTQALHPASASSAGVPEASPWLVALLIIYLAYRFRKASEKIT